MEEKGMTLTKQKTEATKRLKTLVEADLTMREALSKWRKQKLTVMLSCGEVYDIDDEELGSTFINLRNHFERKFPGYMVYHMIELGGPLLAIFYVGPYEEEWEDERLNEDKTIQAYVYNALNDSFSEPGMISL